MAKVQVNNMKRIWVNLAQNVTKIAALQWKAVRGCVEYLEIIIFLFFNTDLLTDG